MNIKLMEFLLISLSLILLTGQAIPIAVAQDYHSRNQGPDRKQMLARSNGGFDGMAFVRPVLSGVLYRGGFSGGDKKHAGLSNQQREELCQAGFSNAYYIDFGTKTDFSATNCGTNQLVYRQATSSNTHDIMKDIYDVIKHPDKGPTLVHCMWGVHSSGSVAAMALVQFCGWTEQQAKAYWEQARNNAKCSGGCDKWIDTKFNSFKVDSTLKISAEEQQKICPKNKF